jgi:hypothetical protein
MNRKAQSNKGDISDKPNLIKIKLTPQIKTTDNVNKRCEIGM